MPAFLAAMRCMLFAFVLEVLPLFDLLKFKIGIEEAQKKEILNNKRITKTFSSMV